MEKEMVMVKNINIMMYVLKENIKMDKDGMVMEKNIILMEN